MFKSSIPNKMIRFKLLKVTTDLFLQFLKKFFDANQISVAFFQFEKGQYCLWLPDYL